MLAARDQENLVHGYRTAAAAKSLNQENRHQQPKTPGNKVPKTPFKVPLNDENGVMAFGGGKTGLKTARKGNENLIIGGKRVGFGDKAKIVTPSVPQTTRAPLGLKTTNAKAKAIQTPATGLVDNGVGKPKQNSVSARKPRLRVSHADTTKLKIHGDDGDAEPEIEYMPPPVKDLPDIPDDGSKDLNLSMFENGGLTEGYMHYYMTRPQADGLSLLQRREEQERKTYDKLDKKLEAMMLRDMESENIPCLHVPDCPGDECKDMDERRRQAEQKYQKTIAALDLPPQLATKTAVTKKAPAPSQKSATAPNKPQVPIRGPSHAVSQSAARALSHPKPDPSRPQPIPKARLPSSLLPSGRKATPPPSNPSFMRHTAATAASRNTLGYSRGRVTSANLRQTVAPPPKEPASTPSATAVAATGKSAAVANGPSPTENMKKTTGLPHGGSELWRLCQKDRPFDDTDVEGEKGGKGDERGRAEREMDKWIMDEAERDFEFTLGLGL